MRRGPALFVATALVAAAFVATPAHAARTCFGKTPTIYGTEGNDVIEGTTGDDVIYAGRGSDTVRGGDGDDLICGGSGEDAGLYGNRGNDRIHAGTSERTTLVFGGKGNDFLYDEPGGGDGQEMFGGPGDDVLKAGDSNGTYLDVLDGGPGDDVMEQGRAEGIFIGGDGDDAMDGGRYNGDRDYLVLVDAPGPLDVDMAAGTMRGWGRDSVAELEIVLGSRFDDTMTGDEERNTFVGGAGDDDLSGAGGDDCLLGAALRSDGSGQCLFPYRLERDSGDDVLVGGDGDDFLTGADGDDGLHGGAGFDTGWFATSEAPVTIDLSAETARGDGRDAVRDLEEVFGSSHADTITGTEGADVLQAYAGAGDVLRGLGGDDHLGVSQTATADGGEGRDTVTYEFPHRAADFVIDLRSDSDTSGNTLTSIENVDATSRYDPVTIHGDDAANVLRGSGFDDDIFGHGGNDLLEGTFGNDDLDGGDGNDTLDGGPVRGGGDGYDTCVNGETLRGCDWPLP